MCKELCTGSIKLTLNIFNILHCLVGLTLLIYGIYCQANYASTFSELVMGLAVFVLLTGLLGLLATRQKSHCLLTIYSILMAILFIANGVILIIALANFHTLIQNISSENSKAKSWLKEHKTIYIYIQVVLVSIEFICMTLGLIYRKSEHVNDVNSDIKYNRFSTADLVLDTNSAEDYGTTGDSTMSASAKHRADIKSKYNITTSSNNTYQQTSTTRKQNNSVSKK